MQLTSPKMRGSNGRAKWFPYYAGFSQEFASDAIDQFCPKKNGTILDPWNGSGTTTSVAAQKNIRGIGVDLNPVMAVVAKARLLNSRERSCIVPLAQAIAEMNVTAEVTPHDGLLCWFAPSTVETIRSLEYAIQKTLLTNDRFDNLHAIVHTREISDILAFFYIALFRTCRELALCKKCSNPTWTKVPLNRAQRLRPSQVTIQTKFKALVEDMSKYMYMDNSDTDGLAEIAIGSSENIPVETGAVDFVLTSPPYCTRIDYAAATRIELAVMGLDVGVEFDGLRRSLIGTPTVPSVVPKLDTAWGKCCIQLLDKVRSHNSKAAESYYFKSMAQYFSSLSKSVREISRCTSRRGRVCAVVQNSFFKDLEIDLATVFTQMSEAVGLGFSQKIDFPIKRSLVDVNTRSLKYRKTTPLVESVLLFAKT